MHTNGSSHILISQHFESRPLVIEPYISSIDAVVAAWLPGSEGQGVSDVIFGDYEISGKLSRTWFKNVDQLPMNVNDSHYDPLFPFGFRLKTGSATPGVSARSTFGGVYGRLYMVSAMAFVIFSLGYFLT
ncbi:uncharacterized protein [Euphorbia lathyris]|uniref:uncharacterized protein n=1 Tax=Euphorbia lathyris TaxID=212925 RepID=UPI0033136731